MPDPHIARLYYRLDHGDTVDFTNAGPLEHETDEFNVRIESLKAVFELKTHFADVPSARAAVEAFTRAWEIRADLRSGREIKFKYDHADIIDRDPKPCDVTVFTEGFSRTRGFGKPMLKIEDSKYPDAPVDFVASQDVETMYSRYVRFRNGAEPLASMAYFCLTVIEDSAGTKGKRQRAASMYGIDEPILKKLGDLVSTAGGAEARKAEGKAVQYSAEQCNWIAAAVRLLIWRAGEAARDPKVSQQRLTMKDLPTLP